METFQIGDVVLLKSGGPKMTVDNVLPDGTISCTWWDGKQMNYGAFKSEMLVKAKLGPSMAVT
jgi:uncharacterized protein YodC (DUF2158 family)